LFWVSQGQSMDDAPLTPPRGLGEVLKVNAQRDLSPGGFTALLHFWSKVSKKLIWLRLLSFLFFIGTCFFLGQLAYRWSRSFFLSTVCALLPFLGPRFFLHYASEIRPYMMEICGVAALVWALDMIR